MDVPELERARCAKAERKLVRRKWWLASRSMIPMFRSCEDRWNYYNYGK
jgi:hypothetical protein